MKKDEVEAKIRECIERVAKDHSLNIGTVGSHKKLVDDLGFSSLAVATLTAFLESVFKIDPFTENLASITDIRTVGDLCNVYSSALSGTVKGSTAKESDQPDQNEQDGRMNRRMGKRSKAS